MTRFDNTDRVKKQLGNGYWVTLVINSKNLFGESGHKAQDAILVAHAQTFSSLFSFLSDLLTHTPLRTNPQEGLHKLQLLIIIYLYRRHAGFALSSRGLPSTG